MTDDLISRSAVDDAIINVVHEVERKCEVDMYFVGRLIDAIENIPTAYDLDKVAEQLEERKDFHVRLANYEMNMGTIVDMEKHKYALEVVDKAIEIVRGGQNE